MLAAKHACPGLDLTSEACARFTKFIEPDGAVYELARMDQSAIGMSPCSVFHLKFLFLDHSLIFVFA
jgi:hypothetical protein